MRLENIVDFCVKCVWFIYIFQYRRKQGGYLMSWRKMTSGKPLDYFRSNTDQTIASLPRCFQMLRWKNKPCRMYIVHIWSVICIIYKFDIQYSNNINIYSISQSKKSTVPGSPSKPVVVTAKSSCSNRLSLVVFGSVAASVRTSATSVADATWRHMSIRSVPEDSSVRFRSWRYTWDRTGARKIWRRIWLRIIRVLQVSYMCQELV